MSTLAQARLIPLSRRYLKLGYRNKIRDRIAPHNKGHILGSLNIRANYTGSLDSYYKAHQFNDIHESRLADISNPLICDQTSREQRFDFVAKKSTSMVTCSLFNMKIHTPITERQYPHINQRQKQQCKLKRYLSSIIHQHRLMSKSPAHIDCSFNEDSQLSDGQIHREEYKFNDANGKRPIYLVAMLGILGLFQKADTSDIEEERSRLSDAQKIEKMKPIELKIAKGVLSMCDQDYAKANVLFHEALHLAQDDEDEEQEVMILNLIAANYFESGNYENAEKLFIDLMRRMIADDVAPTAPAILELSLKLASIYSRDPATHDKALKGFKFVINSLLYDLDDVSGDLDEVDMKELSEEKRNNIALLGWSYDWLAKHLLATSDYKGAAIMLRKALQISAKVLGPHHDQTLILLNDVGTTLAMNNAPGEGKTFIEQAVEGAITSQSQELASFYVNLGLVNLKLRNLNEAIRYCEFSRELASKNRDHYNSHEVDELSKTCLNEVKRQLETERQ